MVFRDNNVINPLASDFLSPVAKESLKPSVNVDDPVGFIQPDNALRGVVKELLEVGFLKLQGFLCLLAVGDVGKRNQTCQFALMLDPRTHCTYPYFSTIFGRRLKLVSLPQVLFK